LPGELNRTSPGALVAVGKDPQPARDNPHRMEIAKKFGLDILPPPGA